MQEEMIENLVGMVSGQKIEDEITKYLIKHNNTDAALYVIDINNFEQIGHAIGELFANEVRKDIAGIIRQVFCEDSIIGQLGREKFVVFQRNFSKVLEEIQAKGKILCEEIQNVYIGENHDICISVNIGIALFPQHGDKAQVLMECAKNALYHTKKYGESNYEIYDEKLSFSDKDNIQKEEQQVPKEKHYKIGKFGNEIIELAFNLMEDSKDVSSVINLLLRRVAAHYHLDAIEVREIINKPRTMRYMYEYVKNKKIPIRLDYELQYSEDEWQMFEKHFKDGYYFYSNEVQESIDITSVENEMLSYKTFLEIPIVSNGRIVGCIDYIAYKEPTHFTKKDIHNLKMFTKVISMYLLNMRNYLDNTYMLEELKDHDVLTGLMKYEVFKKKLQRAITCGHESDNIIIIYSDLKHFKYINETYGYDVGNRLLKRFSERISKDIRGLIATARVYSDNLVLSAYVPSYCEDRFLYDEVLRFNQQLTRELQETFMDNNISVCMGVALIKDKKIDAETAVSNANSARKEAKKLERNTVVMFDDKMMERVVRQMQLNAELPLAIKNKEIKVYYQPKIECGTGKIVGGEALVRWQKSDGTFIYPDEFIPGFEENGLIVDVDYYVYDCVFRYIRERLDAKQAVVPISMNISSVHLKDDNFLPYVKILFQRYEIPARYVEFELTESIYIENLEQALVLIQALRNLGIKISMDDFGSGYSSLNVLNNLPIDVLKLDRIFINREELTINQKIIITCIVEMASKLDIKVVCEGVENKEQANFLTIIGCDMIQGYYYGRPMPQEDFDSYIDEHEKVQFKSVHFPLNGDLKDETGSYIAEYVGDNLEFTEGPFVNSKALLMKQGNILQDIVDIPIDNYINSSYSISCWAKVNEINIWTSIIYMEYDNGFCSLMPNAGDLRGDFRIKLSNEHEDIWHDTGSSVVTDKEWHFYAATYNAMTGVSIFYVDDQIAGYMDEVKSLKDIKRIIVGGDIYTKSFDGMITEVKIYNQSLSKIDIVSVYEQGKQRLKKEIDIDSSFVPSCL